MKLTIIGHVCLDVIHRYDGTEKKGYGGIYFAAAAMANIASDADTIFPVFGVGEKEFDDVRKLLAKYPNVNTDGIYSFEGETNHVHLFYSDRETRTECSKHISSPIPFSRIEPFLSVHGVFLNMISGSDITLETLDQIRLAIRQKNTPLHLDLHSLTLGVDSEASRYRRALSEWRRWCFMVNSVQMNEEEAAGLTVEQYRGDACQADAAAHGQCDVCNARGNGRDDLPARTQTFAAKRISRHPDKLQRPYRMRGRIRFCFSYQYCKTKSFQRSAEFANEVASANSALSGSDEIDRLSQFKASGENGK